MATEAMKQLTRKEARNVARTMVEPIDRVLGDDLPDDEHELEREIIKSAEQLMRPDVMTSKDIQGLIECLAYNLYVDEMPRVKFEHLVFDKREVCVKEGYWPYDMTRQEALDTAVERVDLHHDYMTEARQEVMSGLVEGMEPQGRAETGLDTYHA